MGATIIPENERTEEQFLEAYKKEKYPKPSVTADVAVFRQGDSGLEVLLIRRGNHPFKGCWALPGGFANPNEDVIDAARRELGEETGITDADVELFGIYGAPGRDPRGWTVTGAFCALVDGDTVAQAGDDAADARWFAIEETGCKDENRDRALTLSCESTGLLSTRFEIVSQAFGAPRARIIESDGFAFDHAQIVADAFLKVTH